MISHSQIKTFHEAFCKCSSKLFSDPMNIMRWSEWNVSKQVKYIWRCSNSAWLLWNVRVLQLLVGDNGFLWSLCKEEENKIWGFNTTSFLNIVSIVCMLVSVKISYLHDTRLLQKNTCPWEPNCIRIAFPELRLPKTFNLCEQGSTDEMPVQTRSTFMDVTVLNRITKNFFNISPILHLLWRWLKGSVK